MTLVSERTLDPPLSATAADEGAPQPVLCGSIRWKGREKENLGRRALPPFRSAPFRGADHFRQPYVSPQWGARHYPLG
jgi:hypothetical protein